MKLIIKTLKQVEHDVEVPSDDISVEQLKMKIEKAHSFEASTLKLLFNGTLLQDNKTLKEYKIQDNSIIIMMSSKVKPKNVQPQPEQPKEEQKNESNQQNENPPKVENKPKPKENKTTEPKESKPEPNYSEQISNLESMGFEKSQAEQQSKQLKEILK